MHSALEPAGVQAARILDLFWGFVGVSAAVFVLVILALVIALTRKKSANGAGLRGVVIATALTVATLLVLLVLSVRTSRALASLETSDAVPIDVVGHKWWWEFRYPGSVAGLQFTTAYELHVPVGRPVELRLSSTDVIHSFWVPSLNGKRDLIPGKPSTLLIRADSPGRYEGICAEYCGTQHANMHFVVVAEPEPAFRAWLAHQLEPGTTPADEQTARGQKVFLEGRCVACHAIGGTEAFASVGPNLTHFASRSAIAMGALAQTPANLSSWIAHPDASKPGSIMPGTTLSPDDQAALVAYLESLR